MGGCKPNSGAQIHVGVGNVKTFKDRNNAGHQRTKVPLTGWNANRKMVLRG